MKAVIIKGVFVVTPRKWFAGETLPTVVSTEKGAFTSRRSSRLLAAFLAMPSAFRHAINIEGWNFQSFRCKMSLDLGSESPLRST